MSYVYLWVVDENQPRAAAAEFAKLAFREKGPCFVVRVPNASPLASEVAAGSRLKIERVNRDATATLTWWEGSLVDHVFHTDHVEAISYPDVDPRWLDEEGCEA